MPLGLVHADWILPDWRAPIGVRALFTTRPGGVSIDAWGAAEGGGLNVGLSTGDDVMAVRENRRRLRACLPSEPRWLRQVHGAVAVDAARITEPVAADAAFAATANVVCVVTVADCVPVLLAHTGGRGVAVAHAGWRGLAAGVIQSTANALRAGLGEADAGLIAWLGPAIGPTRFEVGAEVLEAMTTALPDAGRAFVPANEGRYLADLYVLARQALASVGVAQVTGGEFCTASDPQRFYSFRRDRITGRHAALVWLDGQRSDEDG